MSNTADHNSIPDWSAVASAALRVAFGLIWVVDAALTWMPQFAEHYVGYLHNAAQGQPDWSAWWFAMWIAIVTPHAAVFVWLTRLAETALALALLLGFARKSVYIAGALFSILIWSTAGGFGGPYAVGATNMGATIVYVLLFVALMAINHRSGPSLYSIDYLIERRWPGWRTVAESGRAAYPRDARILPWRVQGPALAGIVVLVFFLVAGLYSSMNVKAPTPKAAAAAVSPLSLASNQPLPKARDARLPPAQPGPTANVDIVVTDQKIEIANGVYYQAWTYNGTVPGPIIHVVQGQRVNVTLTNHGTMPHSIDFHAAQVAPNQDFVDVDPGKSIHFSFVAKIPGAFIYHCETMPILLHMANGMYGALVVTPKEGMPPAAESYVIVQSEWYTQQIAGRLMGGDYEKMQEKRPDEVVFNGTAFQYVTHPLPVVAGQRVRLYVVDAGPSLWSSFHVIGAVFDKVYVGGNPAKALDDVSTYSIGPGQGVVFDLVIDKPGKYSFVDHDFANLMKGAHGVLDVLPPGTDMTTAFAGFTRKRVPAKQAPASVASTANTPAGAAPATGTGTTAAAAKPAGPYKFDPVQGKSLYAANCSACHQLTGAGMPGAFPPLKNNPVVLDPDPTKQIEVVLHGLHGEKVMGTVWPGAMPPFAPSLSDAQIANIINHERSSWGNHSRQITPDEVAKLRAKGNGKQK